MGMNDSYSVKNIIRNLAIVLIVIIVFYFITVVVSNSKKNTNSNEGEVSVIQYENILLGNIFSIEENEFYVLVENQEDENITNYKSYITNYEQKEDKLKFYYVDLDSAFNKRYIGEEYNFEKENLKVKGTCLIKVKDKEIIETYIDNDSIAKKLEEISA